MSAISIVRIEAGAAAPISIEEGKTTIGRGPFLQVCCEQNHCVTFKKQSTLKFH